MIHNIQIDDSNPKAQALLAYIKTLEFIKIENTEIPKWQQEEVLKRIKNAKPEDYISWEDAKKQLNFKTK